MKEGSPVGASFLHVRFGGGLPLFAGCREGVFSEPEPPVYGIPGNWASGSKVFSETGAAPDLFLLLCYILALLPLRHTSPPANEKEAGPFRSPPPRLCVFSA